MTNVEITLTMSARQFQFLRTEMQKLEADIRKTVTALNGYSSDDEGYVKLHNDRARLAQLQELLENLG